MSDVGLGEADIFSIIYGSISFVLLVIILVISLKTSIGKKGKKWYKVFYDLQGLLLTSVDHLADTTSDIALIIEFWFAAKKELAENDGIEDYNSSKPNIFIFFIVSIVIMVVYRLKSAIVVYKISGSMVRSVLQFFFDVEIYRAIYINIKLNPSKTISLMKYLRQDECFYESLPQFLLAMIYMIYSGGNNNFIVYVSTFFSFKSFTDRFITFDSLVFKPEANESFFSLKTIKKCTFVSDFKKSIPYILRFMFRFCDITARLIILCFVWTVISYIVFIILLVIELMIWLITRLCFETILRQRAFLHYVAVLVYPPGPHEHENRICKYLPILQFIRNFIVLGILLLFIFVESIPRCDPNQFICSDYEYRNNLIMAKQNRFNLVIFIACNVMMAISVILYPLIKKYLLESQLKATETIATDLWYPARTGNAIDLLANIEYGSHVNVVDERKRTALHYAASRGHTEVINILLSYNKDLNVNLQDNRKWTALHFCVRYAYKNCNNTDGLEAILKESYELDINLKTNKGETALILASKPPFPDEVSLKPVAKILIELNKECGLGMDVTLKDDDGNDALYYWSQIGDEEMVQLLMDQGANQHDTNNDGKSAMHVAQESNHETVVEMMQQHVD